MQAWLAMGEQKDRSTRHQSGLSGLDKFGPFQRRKDGQCWWRDKRFNKWLDETTVHGIVHVFKGKSTVKRVFWAIIFVGSLTGCVYNVSDRLRHLLSDPTVTSIRVEVDEKGVPFPAVTVCNLSPINNILTEFLGIKSFVDTVFGAYLLHAEEESMCPQQLLRDEINDTVKRMTLFDFLTLSQVNVDDFILGCSLGAFSFDSQDFLNCVDQFKPVMTNLGLCYQFNGDRDSTRYVKVSGARYGLNLLIDTHQTLFSPSFLGDAGIKISLTHQGAIPEPDERGIAVSPGKHAYIALKSERIVDLTSKSGCVDWNHPLKFFPNEDYSLTGCKTDAYLQSVLDNCGCNEPVSRLSTLDIMNCTISDLCCVTLSYLSYDISNCPVECDRFEYVATTSYSKFPADSLAEQFAQKYNVSTEILHQDFLSVSIYFETINTFVSETSSSYSVTAFLSDLGGQLGLFLGASVISMLELGLLCVDELKDLIMTKGMKKRVQKFEELVHMPEVTAATVELTTGNGDCDDKESCGKMSNEEIDEAKDEKSSCSSQA